MIYFDCRRLTGPVVPGGQGPGQQQVREQAERGQHQLPARPRGGRQHRARAAPRRARAAARPPHGLAPRHRPGGRQPRHGAGGRGDGRPRQEGGRPQGHRGQEEPN